MTTLADRDPSGSAERGSLTAIDRSPVRAAAAFVAVLWGVFTLVAAHAVTQPRFPFAGDWTSLVYRGPLSSLVSYWQRWDALWYQHIAEAGYRANDGSVAFFPLYPLLARIVSLPVGDAVLVGQLVVSTVSCVGAFALLWWLVRHERVGSTDSRPLVGAAPTGASPRVALLTVVLVGLFPAGFFLLAPFTESLFLMLVVASFALARSDRPWAAGVVAFLAALTRTQGVFLALPIAYQVLATWRARAGGAAWAAAATRRSSAVARIRAPSRPRLPVAILAAGLPIAGLALFAMYQKVALGAGGPGVAALTPWGYTVVAPWDALRASLEYITAPATEDHARLIEILNLVTLVGGTVVAILGVRRLPLAYALYALPSLGILFFRDMYFSPLMSVARYAVVVFPLFVVAAAWLARRPRVAIVVVFVFALLELAMFEYYVRWGFAG